MIESGSLSKRQDEMSQNILQVQRPTKHLIHITYCYLLNQLSFWWLSLVYSVWGDWEACALLSTDNTGSVFTFATYLEKKKQMIEAKKCSRIQKLV